MGEGGVGVGVFGRGGVVGAAAEELGAVVGGLLGCGCQGLHGLDEWERMRERGSMWTYAFFPVFLQPVEVLAVVEELGPEVLEALVGLFLFGGDELPLGHLGVVIDGAGEGGEGCGDLACADGLVLVELVPLLRLWGWVGLAL